MKLEQGRGGVGFRAEGVGALCSGSERPSVCVANAVICSALVLA